MHRSILRLTAAAIVVVPIWALSPARPANAASTTGIWLTNAATECMQANPNHNVLGTRPCSTEYTPTVIGLVDSNGPFTVGDFNTKYNHDLVFTFTDLSGRCLRAMWVNADQTVDAVDTGCGQTAEEWVETGSCTGGVYSGQLVNVNESDEAPGPPGNRIAEVIDARAAMIGQILFMDPTNNSEFTNWSFHSPC